MISKFIIFLFLINTFSNGQKLLLNLSTSSYAGPVGMGVNMGHAYLNSNWAMFLDRLGVNYARLFVTASTDLRNMIKSFGNTWGNDLNGNSVTNQASYLSAVSLLRGPNGRNQAYAWKTSIQWSYIINNLQTASPPIFGSPDNIVKNLNSLNIAKLFVLNIGIILL